MKNKTYCKVEWAYQDIQCLKPDWTQKQCEEFLENNEDAIKDRLTEVGWETLKDFIIMNSN